MPASLRCAGCQHDRLHLVLACALAVLLEACGMGISLDPTAIERPSSLPDVQRDADDERESGVADGEQDADKEGESGKSGIDDGGAPEADRHADAGERDIALDPARDVRVDASEDVSLGGDAGVDGSLDAPLDSPDSPGDESDAPPDLPIEVDGPDAVDGCTIGCGPPVSEYYVDANAAPGGDGSRARPFKTIASAVDAHAAAPPLARTAHIAAGTYDEALGERFPLVLRGLSLDGEGQGKTFIVGSGPLDHVAEGGVLNQRYSVTLVVGDRVLSTSVSRLSLRPVAPVPRTNLHGVFCDRGNATGEVASPSGVTNLDRITAGPGYDKAVAVTTSTVPSATGCNMVITRSTLTGGWTGVEASGCIPNSSIVPVMLEMGNADPASGNAISYMSDSGRNGAGVHGQGCLVSTSFQYNTVIHSDNGVYLEVMPVLNPNTVHYPYVFRHNTFEHLSAYGLYVYGDLVLMDVSDNLFTNISTLANSRGTWGAALSLSLRDSIKIRRNRFIGNQAGFAMAFWGDPPDLGTIEDPGGNVFRCNSAPPGPGTGDLMLMGNAVDPEWTWRGALTIAGNDWDHVPPTVAPEYRPINGTDVTLWNAPHVELDFPNSRVATDECPVGHEPGP